MVPAFTGQPLTAIEPQGFEKRARASMTGPWTRLIGFGSRGYWICEKLQIAFPTPEPGHSFKEKGWKSLGPGKESGSQVPMADPLVLSKTPLCLKSRRCEGFQEHLCLGISRSWRPWVSGLCQEESLPPLALWLMLLVR